MKKNNQGKSCQNILENLLLETAGDFSL